MISTGYALFLAFVNEAIVEHLFGQPLEKKFPNLNRWWLIYVALISGGLLSWFCGINVFGPFMPEIVGRIVTALFVGSGSELLHKLISINL